MKIETIDHYKRKLLVAKDLLAQYVSPPEIAVLGSVHRQNVGDMALCQCVAAQVRDNGKRPGFQLLGRGILGLSRWPVGDGHAIVAGGTLGREARIRPLVERFAGSPERVALVGLSFWSLSNLSEESLKFLKQVNYISCRNRYHIRRLAELGIDRPRFEYDNAFALPDAAVAQVPKRLGINVVSRYMKRKRGRYVAERNNASYGPAYIRVMRTVVQQYKRRGWQVVHIPFTKDDERFAAHVFSGLNIAHRTFDHRVEPVYKAIARCAQVIATRYHAHIFALRTNIPLLSFSYAEKCTFLRQDLGICEGYQATRQDVVERENKVTRRFVEREGFKLGERRIREIVRSVRSNIGNAVETVCRD